MNSGSTSTLRAVTRAVARERILDAAIELASGTGWNNVRMADIAARANVSRRTVFNEFNSKSGLLEAMSWHNTARYMTGSAALLEQHCGDPVDALTAVAEYMLRTIAEDPLAAVVLHGPPETPDEMLSMATTQSGPFVEAATQLGLTYANEHWSALFRADLDLPFFINSLVRLLFSHAIQPTDTPERTAHMLGQLVLLALKVPDQEGLVDDDDTPSPQ